MLYPQEQWQAIAREALSPARLLGRVALPLSLAMAAAVAFGVVFFNTDWSYNFGYRAQPGQWPLIAVTVVLGSLASVTLLAGVFHWLAPMYKVPRRFGNALKVATLGTVPIWLTGLSLVLLPGVIFMIIAFGYSCYLYAVGLSEVCGAPTGQAPEYVAVSMILHALGASALGAMAAAAGLL
jgi:hypothetical protein